MHKCRLTYIHRCYLNIISSEMLSIDLGHPLCSTEGFAIVFPVIQNSLPFKIRIKLIVLCLWDLPVPWLGVPLIIFFKVGRSQTSIYIMLKIKTVVLNWMNFGTTLATKHTPFELLESHYNSCAKKHCYYLTKYERMATLFDRTRMWLVMWQY